MNTNSVQFFEKQCSSSGPQAASQLIVAAWQVGNPENLGKIIRMAHNLGAAKALFIRGNEQHRLSKIKKTAGFSYEQQNWAFISEEEFTTSVLPEYPLIALETCDNAQNLFKTPLPPKAVLLAGSESHGIPLHIIKHSKIQVYIPMPGGCKSMNISNALSVAAFEWFRQQNY